MSFQSTSSTSRDGTSSEATSNSSDVANRRGLELVVDGTQLNATVNKIANLSPAFALATRDSKSPDRVKARIESFNVLYDASRQS